MKYLFFLLALLVSLPSAAIEKDPKGIKNIRKGIYAVQTQGTDGQPLSNGYGFFLNDANTLLTSYSLFINAHKACYTNQKGKTFPLNKVSGANELYDVIKLQTEEQKKNIVFQADTTKTAYKELFLPTPPDVKHNMGAWVTITGTEQVSEGCTYYTLRHHGGTKYTGLPLLNTEGRVIATVQPSMDTDTLLYALDIRYACDISIKAFSVNERSYANLQMPVALPQEADQALVSLLLIADQGDDTRYRQMIEAFIEQFPQSHDGYLRRSEWYMQQGGDSSYALAATDMEHAIKVAGEKADDAHFQIAKQLVRFAADSTHHYADWGYQRAIQETEKAYALNPLPIYLQQIGDIYITLEDFDKAYTYYSTLNQTNLASPDNYLRTALICEQRGDSISHIISLLDSAILFNGKPLTSKAAPYLLERALFYARHNAYRESVKDFNSYERLIGYVSDAQFYYMREQAEVNARMYQQALNDIDRAIAAAPNNASYYLEKALLNIRVNRIEVAMPILEVLAKQFPNDMNCNRLLGYCYVEKGDKAKGLSYLEKAKALGDSNAATLIEQYTE